MKRLYAALAVAAILSASPLLLADPYGGTDIGSRSGSTYPGASAEPRPAAPPPSVQDVEVVIAGRDLRDISTRAGNGALDLRLSGKGTISVGKQPGYTREAVVVEYATTSAGSAAIQPCLSLATAALQSGRTFVIRAQSNVELLAPDQVRIKSGAPLVACGLR